MTNVDDRLAESVRQRLLNIARAEGVEHEYLLLRYANERLLYRLSRSASRDYFVLKGAMVFLVWGRELARQSRDIDLLAATAMATEHVVQVMRNLCSLEVEPDGLWFEPDSVQAQEIREQTEHGGVRVRLTARLGAARIQLQIDVGFGDVVSPDPEETELPTLLDFPSPKLSTYAKETVIAEKFEAMIRLGAGNTRFKDFFDIWTLARTSDFDWAVLSESVRATFEHRRTPLPAGTPHALEQTFAEERAAQWRAFLRRVGVDDAPAFTEVLALLRTFLAPLYERPGGGPQSWEPERGWS